MTRTDATRMTPSEVATTSSVTAPRANGVVVGVDGSATSKAALRWAAGQARATGSRLLAVTTWEMPALAYGSGLPYLGDLDLAGGGRRTLDAALAEAADAVEDLMVSSVVVEGPAGFVLLAEAAHAELLVVGTRGHGGVAGLLLGSVSEHCVAHSPCPVVVVPLAFRP